MQCLRLLRSSSLHNIRPNAHNRATRCFGAKIFPSRNSRHHQIRSFGIQTLQAVLLPPAVFGGLLITLWSYKCLMMVVFQNKIIYMPSVPPFSRSEKVEDYAKQCRPVDWIEHEIRSTDGTLIKLLEGSIKSEKHQNPDQHVVILYFQGNASSIPPRLPYLSNILKGALSNSPTNTKTSYTIITLSYRGYWTSKGSPSQKGIELDAEAALNWMFDRYESPNTKFILWGQSIGAGAASVSLANKVKAEDLRVSRISGLLLETPFVDLRQMLIALYPQKFLPYRYLTPFLFSTWDNKAALSVIARNTKNIKVLLLQAGNDELVPNDHAKILEQVCSSGGMEAQHEIVSGALHTEVMMKGQGRAHIARFIQSI